ncbi:MAG: 3-phosphoshikimate 1-carboxyvinyltransferase [Coprobacter sp.]
MNIQITAPSSCRITIQLPASKSISNRALILNALSYSPYNIQNLSDCDDTQVMVKALESNDNYFDIHAAGTAMRFMTAFLSKIVGEWIITGSERMKQRPIGLLVDALRSLGARIEYIENEGYPPLRIFGSALEGGELSLNGNVSSQYISALLMIAPYMKAGLTLTLSGNIISKPYILMTLQMMKQFGVTAQWNGNVIRVAPAEYKPTAFKVESDWSAASYWYEIAALSPSAEIELIDCKTAYKEIPKSPIFCSLGINTQFTETGIKLRRNGERCKKLTLDLSDQPDLAQTLVTTCAFKNIAFRFSGLQSLKIKETDRIEALKRELRKLGYVINDIQNSILEWNGERCKQEIAFRSTHTTITVWLYCPAAFILPGIQINHPEVVSKSYPSFWDDMKSAGFDIREQ